MECNDCGRLKDKIVVGWKAYVVVSWKANIVVDNKIPDRTTKLRPQPQSECNAKAIIVVQSGESRHNLKPN